MLLAEAVGVEAQHKGKLFVGDAGWKLNYLLKRSGLNRKELRIESAVKCRPPGNGKPSVKHISACYGYLLRTLLKNKPKVVVCLGSVAYQTLLGEVVTQKNGHQSVKKDTKTVSKWRGFYNKHTISWTTKKGKTLSHTFWVVPTHSPNVCLRDWEKDDLVTFDLRIAKQLAADKEPLKSPTTKITVADTFEKALALISRLERLENGFVFDLETTGLSPHTSQLMCAGFCFDDDESHILPWMVQGKKYFWTPQQRRILIGRLTDLFLKAKLIGQNLKFDCKHIRKLTGIVDFNVVFDTMIAHANVDENKPHNLTFQSQWFLRWKKYDAAMDEYKETVGKKTIFRTWDVPNRLLWSYCGYDCNATWLIKKKLVKLLKKEKVVGPFKGHMGLINPLADAEYRGLQCDKERLLYLSQYYRKQSDKILVKLRKQATKLFGTVRDKKGNIVIFNPNSHVQLATLLEAAGADLRKKTKGGNRSTDKFVLEALSTKKTRAGRIAKAVIDRRKFEGYITKNLDGTESDGAFLQFLESNDRFHPNFNIHIARTGRLSADDPPVQTLPRTGAIRSIIIPDTPDHVILSADYEKVELCVLAWLSNEWIMINELLTGVDLHTRMAVVARLMREPTDAEWKELAPLITKDERSVAKGANFGIPYGRGAYAIAEANPDSFPIDMPMKERQALVQRVIDAYFEKYRKIAAFRRRKVALAEQNGELVSALFHRKRRLPGIAWFLSQYGLRTDNRDYGLSHLHREAYNFEVQAIAGDVMTRATKRVYDGIRRSRFPGLRIILTLHDQLVFSCHKCCSDEASEKIVEWMADVLPKGGRHKYEMPLRVECLKQRCFGEEYQSKEEKEEYEGYLYAKAA